MLKEDNITASDTLHNIPEFPGIYIITTSDGQVLYIGSSTTLRRSGLQDRLRKNLVTFPPNLQMFAPVSDA